MNIISWNCNMAFRNKCARLLAFSPDIIVVQECEQKSKLLPVLQDCGLTDILWFGDNPHKGIAILSFHNYSIQLNELYNPEFKYVIPIILTSQNVQMNLFIIWAMPHKSQKAKSYVGQIWRAVHYYEKLLKDDSVLIGDFNSHVRWDSERKIGNHSALVSFLLDRQIVSCYHHLHKLPQGQEKKSTWYMYKHRDKGYHLDYCFASQALTQNLEMNIGAFDDWIQMSDHMPLSISLKRDF